MDKSLRWGMIALVAGAFVVVASTGCYVTSRVETQPTAAVEPTAVTQPAAEAEPEYVQQGEANPDNVQASTARRRQAARRTIRTI